MRLIIWAASLFFSCSAIGTFLKAEECNGVFYDPLKKDVSFFNYRNITPSEVDSDISSGITTNGGTYAFSLTPSSPTAGFRTFEKWTRKCCAVHDDAYGRLCILTSYGFGRYTIELGLTKSADKTVPIFIQALKRNPDGTISNVTEPKHVANATVMARVDYSASGEISGTFDFCRQFFSGPKTESPCSMQANYTGSLFVTIIDPGTTMTLNGAPVQIGFSRRMTATIDKEANLTDGIRFAEPRPIAQQDTRSAILKVPLIDSMGKTRTELILVTVVFIF